MFATIDVISGREGTFKVSCVSIGGVVLSVDVSGPRYFHEEEGSMQVVAVGELYRKGNDSYSATTSVISGGHNGDLYYCIASNGIPPGETNNVELIGEVLLLLLSVEFTSLYLQLLLLL